MPIKYISKWYATVETPMSVNFKCLATFVTSSDNLTARTVSTRRQFSWRPVFWIDNILLPSTLTDSFYHKALSVFTSRQDSAHFYSNQLQALAWLNSLIKAERSFCQLRYIWTPLVIQLTIQVQIESVPALDAKDNMFFMLWLLLESEPIKTESEGVKELVYFKGMKISI